MTETAEQNKGGEELNPKVQKLMALKAIQQVISRSLGDYRRLAEEMHRQHPAIASAVESCQERLSKCQGASEEQLKQMREEFTHVENVLGLAVRQLQALQATYAELRAAQEHVAAQLKEAEEEALRDQQ